MSDNKMKIKKESFEMFYQLIFAIVGLWLSVVLFETSLVPMFAFGAMVLFIRVYKKEQELNKK